MTPTDEYVVTIYSNAGGHCTPIHTQTEPVGNELASACMYTVIRAPKQHVTSATIHDCTLMHRARQKDTVHNVQYACIVYMYVHVLVHVHVCASVIS
jgi:hypothetical protein